MEIWLVQSVQHHTCKYIPYTFLTRIQINQIWWNIWFRHSSPGKHMEKRNQSCRNTVYEDYEYIQTTGNISSVCHKWCRGVTLRSRVRPQGLAILWPARDQSVAHLWDHYLGRTGGVKLDGSLCPQYRHELVSDSVQPGSGLLNSFLYSRYKECILQCYLTAPSVQYARHISPLKMAK